VNFDDDCMVENAVVLVWEVEQRVARWCARENAAHLRNPLHDVDVQGQDRETEADDEDLEAEAHVRLI